MLRHCPIPRFSSSGARRKMPNVVCGKEKTLHVPMESQAIDLADPKDVASEPLPPQKVLKIFSINIIAQGLPFCRRRVSIVYTTSVIRFGFGWTTEPEKSKVILQSHTLSLWLLLRCVTAGLSNWQIKHFKLRDFLFYFFCFVSTMKESFIYLLPNN